ncbi:MAG: hypothetical protein Q8R11_03220 [bacterium]|nr:hypothetical protein [bacterium]
MDSVSNENAPKDKLSPWWMIGGIVGVFLLADLGFLHWKVLFDRPAIPLSPSTAPIALIDSPTACPTTCAALIKDATSSIVLPTPYPQPTPVTISSTQPNPPQVSYIPIGGGTTEKKEWAEIPGAEVTIDTANYEGKRTVTWEAALKVLSGNGRTYARFKNMSTKLSITDSQISASADPAVQVVSEPFSLAGGKVTYRVEMYTTTGYRATLESGRIKITVE